MESANLAGSSQQAVYDPALLAELTQKLGSVEKAKEVYALFSASLMPTVVATSSLPIPADSAAQTTVSQEGNTHTGTASQEADDEEEALKRLEDDRPTNSGAGEEKEAQGSGNPNLEGSEEGVGGTPVFDEVVEEGTPTEGIPTEGEETPIDFRGSTPETMEEGATPSDVRGENPVYIEGATPIVDGEGGTPGELVENAELQTTDVPESDVEGLHLIVDLVNEQEEDVPKVDERAERRRTRRSLLDEVEDLVPEATKAEERRLEKKKKRKGKGAATSSTRSRKAPSVKEVKEPLSPVIEESSVEEQDEPTPTHDSDSEEMEEVPIPGRPEVWLTKELLEAMRQFDDQKRTAVYAERC